jgi:RNA polymerase sigma-70 factor (ECF subfamily)
MTETPEANRATANAERQGAHMSAPEALAWFLREVLPLEAMLMQYLRHNWRDQSDIEDLVQEVYVRVFEAARKEIPEKARPFLFTTARNLLINRVRDRRVVPMEAALDLDALGIAIDTPAPDQSLMARDELRRLREAIDSLPQRYRDVVVMRRIEDLSRAEVAQRLGINETTVSEYLAKGMYALADIIYGESVNPRRRP